MYNMVLNAVSIYLLLILEAGVPEGINLSRKKMNKNVQYDGQQSSRAH
jgi:hypothetical protein